MALTEAIRKIDELGDLVRSYENDGEPLPEQLEVDLYWSAAAILEELDRRLEKRLDKLRQVQHALDEETA